MSADAGAGWRSVYVCVCVCGMVGAVCAHTHTQPALSALSRHYSRKQKLNI